MRKDILAAGGRRASYGVTGKVGDEITLKNVAPEGSFDETPIEVTPVVINHKRFIPTLGVLLVRRAEAVSPSGVIITETTMEKERPSEGVVLEAGPTSVYSIGDYIVFGKYAGAEFPLNGETLLLIDESEVKGTLVDFKPVDSQDGWTVDPAAIVNSIAKA